MKLEASTLKLNSRSLSVTSCRCLCLYTFLSRTMDRPYITPGHFTACISLEKYLNVYLIIIPTIIRASENVCIVRCCDDCSIRNEFVFSGEKIVLQYNY